MLRRGYTLAVEMPTEALSPISAVEEESSIESGGHADHKRRLDKGGTALCIARGSTSVRVPDDSSGGQTPATTANTAVETVIHAAGLDSDQLLLLHVVQSEWAEEDRHKEASKPSSGTKSPRKVSPRSPVPSKASSKSKSSRSPMRSCASEAPAVVDVTFASAPSQADWERQLRKAAELEKRLQQAEAQLLESQQHSELKDVDVAETNAAAWEMAEAAQFRVSNVEAMAYKLEEQASEQAQTFHVQEAELAKRAAMVQEQQAHAARTAEVKLRTQLMEEAARLRQAESAVLDMNAKTELFLAQRVIDQQSYAAELERVKQLAAGTAAVSQSAVEHQAAAAVASESHKTQMLEQQPS